MKKFVLTFILIWLFVPTITANAFAGGQINNWNFFEISMSDSIGYALLTSLALAIIWFVKTSFIIIPIFIFTAYFVHRKFFIYIFGGLYVFLFLLAIIAGKFSIRQFAILFFLAVLGVIICFFISTLFNKIKKNKQKFSKKDYIPLAILVGITFILLLLPIKTGDVLCKTPLINKSFNCENYLNNENS